MSNIVVHVSYATGCNIMHVGFDVSTPKNIGEGDKRWAFPNIFFVAVVSVGFAFWFQSMHVKEY
jgi:hypothetical protein